MHDGKTFVNSIRQVNQKLVKEDVSYLKEDLLQLMKSVCRYVLETSDSKEADQLISLICEYLYANDVKYLVLNSLLTIFKSADRNDEQVVDEKFIARGAKVLTAVKLLVPGKIKKKRKLSDEDIVNLDENTEGITVLIENPDSAFSKTSLSYGKLADLFASVWLSFLSFKVSKSSRVDLLLILPSFF